MRLVGVSPAPPDRALRAPESGLPQLTVKVAAQIVAIIDNLRGNIVPS
jgi:hypothetical protein